MKNKEKKSRKVKHSEKSCCFNVVDACGCIVGTYCCDGPDMKSCSYESIC